jgi:hypothetical protein
MQPLVEHLLANFTFPQGSAPQIAAEPKVRANEKTGKRQRSPPAPKMRSAPSEVVRRRSQDGPSRIRKAVSLGATAVKQEPAAPSESSDAHSIPGGGMCACSGNCGRQPCKKNSNERRPCTTRSNSTGSSICASYAVAAGSYCRHCTCESDGCSKARNKLKTRWCHAHGVLLQRMDYAVPQGGRSFQPDHSLAMKCVLRSNYLLPLLVPDDNAAWQDIGREFNRPVAGSLMNPIGVVICLMAHSIKWPLAIRHFQKTLRNFSAAISGNRSPSAVSPITAAHIVTAFRDAILWVDGKELRNMHDGLSVSRRSHATSGIIMAGKDLGLLDCVPETASQKIK